MPNPNFKYKGLPNYGYPNRNENIGLLIGTLLGAGLGAAGGENTADALLRGGAGGIASYGSGLRGIQDYNTDAFKQQTIADQLLYEPQEQERAQGIYDLAQKKYNQDIMEYEETGRPSSQAYAKYMNSLTDHLLSKPPENLSADAKTWEYAENIQDPRKRSEFKARAMPMKRPDQTNVNVSTGSGSKFIEELGKKSAEEFVKQKETAQDSLNTLNIISEAKNKIDSGIYTGAGANAKLFMDKWLQTAGINIGGETASNTEAFAGAVGSLVGKLIRQFGSGTGLSDADREYAQKIAGGEITMTDMSIRKLFDIAQRAQRFQVSSYNKMFEKIQSTHGKENMPYDMSIDLPKEMDFGVSNLESGNFGQETQMQKIGNYLYDPTTGKYYKQ